MRPDMGIRAGEPDNRSRALELEVTWEGDGVRIVLSDGDTPTPTVIQRRRKTVDKDHLLEICDQVYSTLQSSSHGRSKPESTLEDLRQEGHQLFDLLLDNETQSELLSSKAEFLLLVIDDALVGVPWELLFDGQAFLSDRFAMGRRVLTEVRSSGSDRMRALRSEPVVSVMGNGQGDLQSISQEGHGIFEALSESSYQVEVNLESNTEDFKSALREAEIVHFCGHAEFNRKDPHRSSLVLEGGARLSAEEISQTLNGSERVPRLVFLNACGSGLSGDWTKDSAEAAFGLGNAFLLAGVGHVIVALGDVADDHSASFSEVFYQYLGRGEPVGKSLQLAGAVSGIERVSGRNYVLYGLPQSTVQGILDPDSSRKGSEETVLKVFLFTDLVD
ncbi:MAG: CHAT domain-containing protein, partial [Candidatus Omnitrophica bacterium]|nr:CHAT domain-containing protein [Candidatus Omnitrophota bacterium]